MILWTNNTITIYKDRKPEIKRAIQCTFTITGGSVELPRFY